MTRTEPISYVEATIRALEEDNAELLAEIERLRAALDEIIPFAVYSLAEMNKERNTKPIEKAIAKAVAALAAQPAAPGGDND